MSHGQYSFVRDYVSSGHGRQTPCKALKRDTPEISGEIAVTRLNSDTKKFTRSQVKSKTL